VFQEKGGFDVVIANPPYDVLLKEHPLLQLYKNNYAVCKGGKVNLYKLFFERGLDLLRLEWVFSYITPSNYLSSGDSVQLRELLLRNKIINIIDYEEADNIFKNVTQAVTVIVLLKIALEKSYYFVYEKKGIRYSIDKVDILKSGKHIIKGTNDVITKLSKIETKLADYVDGWQGEINVSTKKHYFSSISKAEYLPLIRGNQIGLYQKITEPMEYCPIRISARDHFRYKRVVIQEVCNSGISKRLKGLIMQNILCGHTTNYLIPKQDNGVSIKYLLGLINSSLLNYYFKFFNQTNHIPIGEVKCIPFLVSNNSVLIENCVDKIISAREKNLDTSDLESQVNKLIYELYELSSEEIRIVEESL
jgi:hypothetical protein